MCGGDKYNLSLEGKIVRHERSSTGESQETAEYKRLKFKGKMLPSSYVPLIEEACQIIRNNKSSVEAEKEYYQCIKHLRKVIVYSELERMIEQYHCDEDHDKKQKRIQTSVQKRQMTVKGNNLSYTLDEWVE